MCSNRTLRAERTSRTAHPSSICWRRSQLEAPGSWEESSRARAGRAAPSISWNASMPKNSRRSSRSVTRRPREPDPLFTFARPRTEPPPRSIGKTISHISSGWIMSLGFKISSGSARFCSCCFSRDRDGAETCLSPYVKRLDRPEKVLYLFCVDADAKDNDFMAVIDVDPASPTYPNDHRSARPWLERQRNAPLGLHR